MFPKVGTFFIYFVEKLLCYMSIGMQYVGGEAGNERKPGLYCCNYCDKDLSGLVRLKCAVCADFDLCVECFYVGVELNRHKSSHPYRVMVSFQPREQYVLFCLFVLNESTLLCDRTICLFRLFLLIGMRMKRYSFLRYSLNFFSNRSCFVSACNVIINLLF